MSFTISSYDSANVVHMPEKLTMANANSVKQQLTEMIEDGKTRPIIDRVYPVENTTEAHQRVESEQRLGSVILTNHDN